jgi:hypothetical protein
MHIFELQNYFIKPYFIVKAILLLFLPNNSPLFSA